VLADVFGAEIRALAVGNSSALGGALRAAEAAGAASFSELYARFAATDPARDVGPTPGATARYGELRQKLLERLTALGA
jgi:sugar (pentulose or hexulose) kinase